MTVSSTAYSGVTTATAAPYFNTLSSMSVSAIAALHLSTDYFFLPAAGYMSLSVQGTSGFSSGGTYGGYWSSTPYYLVGYANLLNFSSSFVGINGIVSNNRTQGLTLWVGQ